MTRDKKKIKFEGLVYEPSGYGTVGREAIQGLAPNFHGTLLGYEGRFGTGDAFLTEEQKKLFRMMQNAKFDQYDIRLSFMAAYKWLAEVDDCKYSILATVHEANYVQKEWVEICNGFDEIWVPSTFVKNVFETCGVKNVNLFPHGVSPIMFETFEEKVLDQSRYNFLSIFEPQFRKGYDVLLNAYFEEFTSDDNVTLVLKANPHQAPAVVNMLRQYHRDSNRKDTPSVKIIAKFLTYEELSQLYDSSSAYVFPTRGEGFSLTCLEAMAHGLPTLATDYSAMQDYMTPENSFPIKVAGMVELGDNQKGIPWYEPDMLFAEPDKEHLKAVMRQVYKEDITNIPSAIEKAKEYKWSKIISKMTRHLDDINTEG